MDSGTSYCFGLADTRVPSGMNLGKATYPRPSSVKLIITPPRHPRPPHGQDKNKTNEKTPKAQTVDGKSKTRSTALREMLSSQGVRSIITHFLHDSAPLGYGVLEMVTPIWNPLLGATPSEPRSIASSGRWHLREWVVLGFFTSA